MHQVNIMRHCQGIEWLRPEVHLLLVHLTGNLRLARPPPQNKAYQTQNKSFFLNYAYSGRQIPMVYYFSINHIFSKII